MQYVGVAYAADLISTSLPALDSFLPIQFLIMFHILSRKYLKIPAFSRPMRDGNPKYFLVFSASETPNNLFNSSRVGMSIFEL